MVFYKSLSFLNDFSAIEQPDKTDLMSVNIIVSFSEIIVINY